MIQTTMPENATIGHAARQDFEGFFAEEIAVRKLFGYPPFCRMAKCTFSGENEKKTERFANAFWHALKQRLPAEFELHPPMPAGYAKVKGKYRFQFLVKGKNIYSLTHAIEAVMQGLDKVRNININIDVDPSSTYF